MSRTGSAPQRLLVTAKIGDSSRRWVWDAAEPMGMGRPFRWVFERTEDGIRVRDLSRGLDHVRVNSFRDVSNAALASGEPTEARFQNVTFLFKPMRDLAPAFAEAPVSGSATPEHFDAITAYQCIGDWVVAAEAIAGVFRGRLRGETLFTITASGHNGSSQYSLVTKAAGLSTHEGAALAAGEKRALTSTQLRELGLQCGEYRWRFAAQTAAALPDTQAKLSVEERDENLAFKKALSGAGIAVALLLSASWISTTFWPKGNTTDELVPPQYVSVVMNQKPQGGSAHAETESPRESVAAPTTETAAKPTTAKPVSERVQKAAVVQAFRATALQNAVSGLLKGGMTKLMQDSEFVSGKTSKEAHKVFETASRSLGATGDLLGSSKEKNVAVGSIGGEGTRGAAGQGKGVGYGQGEHAAVKGQGKNFVSMDVGNSTVEEGLTKDEVGEVIHRHLSEVRYCYESAMLRQADLEGKLVLNFTIGSSGAVKSSEIKSSTLPDPRLDDCVLRRLVTWQFPKTKGGIDVAVSYPFIFKTLGR